MYDKGDLIFMRKRDVGAESGRLRIYSKFRSEFIIRSHFNRDLRVRPNLRIHFSRISCVVESYC